MIYTGYVSGGNYWIAASNLKMSFFPENVFMAAFGSLFIFFFES